MKLLFITMVWPDEGQNNMYSELMQEFSERGHHVCVVALSERRNGIRTHLSQGRDIQVLYVACGNIQKTNKYRKVISSFTGGFWMYKEVSIYFRQATFDVVLFALPPLMIAPFVIWLKRKFHAPLYLMLKEFWPQDPVDLGAMRQGGMVWKVFRYFEVALYKYSDYIGTMSEAGIRFLKKNNPWIQVQLEVCPNSQRFIEPMAVEREEIRAHYGIPQDKCVFVFGGNLGLSQGIDEMIAQIKSVRDRREAFFLIIGSGTEYARVHDAFSQEDPTFVKVCSGVPRNEFDRLLCACDVGLIFLNPCYTVPNVPSRLVSYLLSGLPVLACVDPVTDVGTIVEAYGCGIQLINGETERFQQAVDRLCRSDIRQGMRENSRKLMKEQYTTERCYHTIARHFVSEGASSKTLAKCGVAN